MITFKQFVLEALAPSEYRNIVKGWDKSKLEKEFKSSKLEKDRQAYRLYFPLGTAPAPIKIPVDVSSELADLNYDVDDYTKGLAKHRTTGRVIRIGKLPLSPHVLRTFMNDKSRSATQSDYEGVISRHPYDIAGMSTDRGWTSCMDLRPAPGRVNRCEYVPTEIQAGALIAYMIKAGDRDIKNPVGRLLIKPYINDKQETAYAISGDTKGETTPEFIKKVNDFVDELNKSKGIRGLFTLDMRAYHNIADSLNIVVGNDDVLKLIIKNEKHIDTLSKEQLSDEGLQLEIVKFNGNLIENLFKKGLTPSVKVQIEAVNNRSFAYYHIAKYVKRVHDAVQIEAVSKNGFMIEYIEYPSEPVQLRAIFDSPEAIQHIEYPAESVQLYVMKHNPKLFKLIKNPTDKVKAMAGGN